MMNKKSLYKLEYNKIIEKLTEHAGSFGGQERCRKLKPKTEISEIERMQEETAAAFTRIIICDASGNRRNTWKWGVTSHM